MEIIKKIETKMSLTTYGDFLTESEKKKQWITNQVLNTDRPHDEIKKEFLQKYPKHEKLFDKHVSDLVD